MVRKALEGRPATRPREEGQLARPDDFQRRVANLELAAPRAVVTPRAEAEVGPAAANIVRDAAVALPVEHAAVAQVGAAGEDQERAGRRPRLLEEDGLGNWDDGVVGGEEAAESVETVLDWLYGGAGAWDPLVLSLVLEGKGAEKQTSVDQDV